MKSHDRLVGCVDNQFRFRGSGLTSHVYDPDQGLKLPS